MKTRRVSTGALRRNAPDVNVGQSLAAIQKGQQLAGHFPSDSDLDRARRILTGELSADAAEAEMNEALARIVAREHAVTHGR